MSFVESCNHFLSWSDQNFAKMSHEMWANHKVPIEDHYFMKFCFGATGVDRQFEWPGGGGAICYVYNVWFSTKTNYLRLLVRSCNNKDYSVIKCKACGPIVNTSKSNHNYGCWIELDIFFHLGSNYKSHRLSFQIST